MLIYILKKNLRTTQIESKGKNSCHSEKLSIKTVGKMAQFIGNYLSLKPPWRYRIHMAWPSVFHCEGAVAKVGGGGGTTTIYSWGTDTFWKLCVLNEKHWDPAGGARDASHVGGALLPMLLPPCSHPPWQVVPSPFWALPFLLPTAPIQSCNQPFEAGKADGCCCRGKIKWDETYLIWEASSFKFRPKKKVYF